MHCSRIQKQQQRQRKRQQKQQLTTDLVGLQSSSSSMVYSIETRAKSTEGVFGISYMQLIVL